MLRALLLLVLPDPKLTDRDALSPRNALSTMVLVGVCDLPAASPKVALGLALYNSRLRVQGYCLHPLGGYDGPLFSARAARCFSGLSLYGLAPPPFHTSHVKQPGKSVSNTLADLDMAHGAGWRAGRIHG